MSIYTAREKLRLYQKMKEQTKEDSYYIYRVLIKNGEEHSVNSNGVFFDLDAVGDETLRELSMYYKVLRPLKEDKPYYEED